MSNHNSRGGGPPGFDGFLMCLGAAAVLLFAPQIDGWTANFVYRWAAVQYGPDLGMIIRWGWALCIAGLIFFGTYMTGYAAAFVITTGAFFKYLPG